MTVFEASNGVPIRRGSGGYLTFSHEFGLDLGTLTGITVSQEQALREFFQHERDEELGRWRWPENPDYVVYAQPDLSDAHQVLRESDGALAQGGIRRSHPRTNNLFNMAAWAYFDAHPDKKPWEQAKTGDGWVLTFPAGPAVALRRSDGSFYDYEGNRLHTDRVSDARRIWPEGDAS